MGNGKKLQCNFTPQTALEGIPVEVFSRSLKTEEKRHNMKQYCPKKKTIIL